MILAFIWACGGGGGAPVDDWSGDWDGTLDPSNVDGDPWPFRLIDVTDDRFEVDPDAPAGLREWRGIVEFQMDDDHVVLPFQLLTCESDDGCDFGSDNLGIHGYSLIGDSSVSTVTSLGAIDGDTIDGDASWFRPGRPILGHLTLALADGDLQVGDL